MYDRYLEFLFRYKVQDKILGVHPLQTRFVVDSKPFRTKKRRRNCSGTALLRTSPAMSRGVFSEAQLAASAAAGAPRAKESFGNDEDGWHAYQESWHTGLKTSCTRSTCRDAANVE